MSHIRVHVLACDVAALLLVARACHARTGEQCEQGAERDARGERDRGDGVVT